MNTLIRAIRHYKLFFIAFIVTVLALVLTLSGQQTAAQWILSIVVILELLPLVWRMGKEIRIGTYGVDILAATAIVTAVIMQEYWAAMVIVLMLTGGEALEDYAGHRAERELTALLAHKPAQAHVVRGRKTIDVKASDVQAGDTIIVQPGEVVPVDGRITDGATSLDESSLTGESIPQTKQPGDPILSGSVNLDGVITAKALHSAAESQYEQIIKLVKAARASQAPFVRMADRYAIPFTIISLGIAITAWAISGESIRFLEVLVVATPCPLILAAPIAIISGMSRAAKQGIIIKNCGSLERLANARTFAFDKTGTLTKGELKVDHITTYNGFTRAEVLAVAGSLEQHSGHALATAIIAKATGEHAKLQKTRNVREVAGKGVMATIKGRSMLVGTQQFLEEYAIPGPQGVKNAKHDEQTAAFVAINGTLAGVITMSDEVRTDAKQTIHRLQSLGIKHFMMVTGDNKQVAQSVARHLGIRKVIARALPGDKLRAIESAAERPVAFVGDGVNDAPVLTAADIGIALGAKGSAAASESADVVVMLDEVSRVATAVTIAKRTFRIARQSILVGIGLSVGLMLIFATGHFKPLYGALIQEIVDIVVIFNALRAHRNP
jgi:heavy metal translocating P-type ATPase